jgi:hypothetical protein
VSNDRVVKIVFKNSWVSILKAQTFLLGKNRENFLPTPTFIPSPLQMKNNFQFYPFIFWLHLTTKSGIKKYQHPKLQIGKSDKIFSEQLLYLFWYKKVFNLSAEHSLKSFWFVITYCSSKLHNFWICLER